MQTAMFFRPRIRTDWPSKAEVNWQLHKIANPALPHVNSAWIDANHRQIYNQLLVNLGYFMDSKFNNRPLIENPVFIEFLCYCIDGFKNEHLCFAEKLRFAQDSTPKPRL